MIKHLLIGALALTGGGSAMAQLPASYELQSRCANDAAAFFARYKQEVDDGERQSPPSWRNRRHTIRTTYENNFSTAMNGCFILITSQVEWAEATPEQTKLFTTYILENVLTHHEIASYGEETFGNFKREGSCQWEGVLLPYAARCADWEARIKPYLHND